MTFGDRSFRPRDKSSAARAYSSISAPNGPDLASILDIYNDAIEHTTAVFDDTPHTLDARRQWFAAKQKAALPVLVAVESEAVIGFATYGPFRPWPGYKYSVEHSVYVHPAARRRGVGTALVRAIVDGARSRDLHTIVAGFREVGHLFEVGYKFGRWLDLTLLQLSLHRGEHHVV